MMLIVVWNEWMMEKKIVNGDNKYFLDARALPSPSIRFLLLNGIQPYL